MEIISLLIYILATWRIASLLVNEAGPADIFLHIREWAGIEHDDSGEMTIIPDGFFSGILSCVWCSSMWVAAGWILFDQIVPLISIRMAAIFAVSAGTIWVENSIRSK